VDGPGEGGLLWPSKGAVLSISGDQQTGLAQGIKCFLYNCLAMMMYYIRKGSNSEV